MYATLNMLQMSLFKKFLWNTIGWIAGIKQSSTRHYSFLNLLFFCSFSQTNSCSHALSTPNKGNYYASLQRSWENASRGASLIDLSPLAPGSSLARAWLMRLFNRQFHRNVASSSSSVWPIWLQFQFLPETVVCPRRSHLTQVGLSLLVYFSC